MLKGKASVKMKKFQKIVKVVPQDASVYSEVSMIDIIFNSKHPFYGQDSLRLIIQPDGNIRLIKSESFPHDLKVKVESFGYPED